MIWILATFTTAHCANVFCMCIKGAKGSILVSNNTNSISFSGDFSNYIPSGFLQKITDWLNEKKERKPSNIDILLICRSSNTYFQINIYLNDS